MKKYLFAMKNHISMRLATFVLLLTLSFAAMAQNRISVKEELYDDRETTAMTYPMKDRNNAECALVIFHNVEPDGYLFDGNGMFIKAENHVSRDNGEKTIFLYISPGAKQITIRHSDPSIGATRYVFENGPLQGRSTYHVYFNPVVSGSKVGRQYARFVVSPATAVVEVEEDGVDAPGVFTPWPVDDSGVASKMMRFGRYNYRVSAPDYHPTGGVIIVDNPTDVVVEKIDLKPNYGYLTIPASKILADAAIFIDGRQAGVGSLTRFRLANGAHEVKITKPLYKLYQANVTIDDGAESRLEPLLETNFATVSLSVPLEGAGIYVREGSDDRLLGFGSWEGPFEPGSYLIVCKLGGHRESMRQIDVAAKTGNLQFNLPVPEAMYGGIDISSVPAGASIRLDDNDMGVTPKVINNVLCGDHAVEFSMKGYEPLKILFTVKEGEIASVCGKLSTMHGGKLGKLGNPNANTELALRTAKDALKNYDDIYSRSLSGQALGHLSKESLGTYLISGVKNAINATYGEKERKEALKLIGDHAADLNVVGTDLYANIKNYKLAADAFELCASIYSDEELRRDAKLQPLPASTLAQMWFNAGITAWQNNDYERSLMDFDRADKAGYKADKFYEYGIAVASQLNNDLVIEWVDRGIAGGAPEQQLVLYKINAQLEEKRYADAEKTIADVLSRYPNDENLLYAKGMTYELQKRNDDALAAYSELLKVQPENASAAQGAGRVLLDKATALSEKAPAENYEAWFNTNVKPLLEQAITYFEAAYTGGADNGDAILKYLENIYYQLGDYQRMEEVRKLRGSAK